MDLVVQNKEFGNRRLQAWSWSRSVVTGVVDKL